ncbi:MAG: hypothetical protein M0020_00420 [Actinomycetota bacterium]|nr:hypothetical protein [Actinomycetota bacterium]
MTKRRSGRRRAPRPRRRDPAGAGAQGGEPRPLRLGHWRADGLAKRRFATEADANRAGLAARLEGGVDLAAYACDLCGGWHLGNSPG